MLTTSIAFGQFSYRQRLEFVGIEKNQISGNAYVKAVLDNEIGKPKIQPGQCRIVNQNIDDLQWNQSDLIEESNSHIFYYWIVDHDNEISAFKQDFTNAYYLKYQGILSAIKKASSKISVG